MRRLAAALTLVVASAALLVGCAAPPAIDPATGDALQSAVIQVADTANAGDVAGALAQLDSLERDLLQATAEGRVGSDRSVRITAAIAIVRDYLTSQLPIEPTTPGTAVAPEESGEGGDGGGQGNGKDNGKDNGKKDK